MRRYVPSLRTHRKTGHHRVLFGLRDCHIWQPMLLVTLKILGFFSNLALARVRRDSVSNWARGVSESISGTILPFFFRLTHLVNCYSGNLQIRRNFLFGFEATATFKKKLLQRAVAISLFIYLTWGIGIGGIGMGLCFSIGLKRSSISLI